MDPVHIALGTAVTVVAAVSGALWRIVLYVRDIDTKQTDYRHDAVNRLDACIREAEERVTRRLERVEQLSYGFRSASRARYPEPGHDDEQLR